MFFFFFNDTATTEIYTLSLHDALPIYCRSRGPDDFELRRSTSTESIGASSAPKARSGGADPEGGAAEAGSPRARDRKSTRLNSSHSQISYAVFCLKKKKRTTHQHATTA